MTSQVFALGPAKAPWGDYGRILLHGMSSHLPRENGTIQLERTGPFVPPLSFPGVGDVIATDATVEMLATSGLTPVQWKPVAKRRIAELDWRSWHLSASSPAALPPHGKPEAYVLENPHAPELAQAMPALWELEASVVGSGTQQRLGSFMVGVGFEIVVPKIHIALGSLTDRGQFPSSAADLAAGLLSRRVSPVAPVVVAGATIAEGRPADLQLHAVPLGGDTDVLRGEALPLGPAVGVGDRPELAHFLETPVAHPTLAPLVAGDDARACRRREKD